MSGRPAPVREPVAITLATYNTMNLFDSRHPVDAKPAREMRALAVTVDRMLPDVLALQEVGSIAALEEFNARLRAPFPHLGLLPGNSARHISVAFMSRLAFRMTSHAARILRDEAGAALLEFRSPADRDAQRLSPLRFQRDCLLGEFHDGGSTCLAVFNVHLKSRHACDWYRHSSDAIRLAEAREVARIVQAYRRRHAPAPPVAVVGDFNEVGDHDSVRPLSGASGLSDPLGDELAGCGQRPSTYWSKHAQRIDHVLLCERARRAYVHGSAAIVANAAARKASDHLPVKVTLRW